MDELCRGNLANGEFSAHVGAQLDCETPERNGNLNGAFGDDVGASLPGVNTPSIAVESPDEDIAATTARRNRVDGDGSDIGSSSAASTDEQHEQVPPKRRKPARRAATALRKRARVSGAHALADSVASLATEFREERLATESKEIILSGKPQTKIEAAMDMLWQLKNKNIGIWKNTDVYRAIDLFDLEHGEKYAGFFLSTAKESPSDAWHVLDYLVRKHLFTSTSISDHELQMD